MFGFIRRSLFVKILLIFSLAAILMIGIIASAIHYMVDDDAGPKQHLMKHLAEYATMMVNEIGVPPDYATAASIATEMGLTIRVHSDETVWSSNGDKTMPVLRSHYSMRWKDSEFSVNKTQGGSVVRLQKDDYIFYFEHSHRLFEERKMLTTLLLAIFIVGILLISYHLVRWILRPIRSLEEGARRLSQGDLKHRAPERSMDELGKLTTSFNEMAVTIEEIVSQKEQLMLDVSHELRTPITRINLALELMEDNPHKPKIKEDLLQMQSMITNILESARLDRSRNHGLQIEIHDIVEATKKIVKDYTGIQPGVVCHFEKQSIECKFDYDRMAMLIKNLVENALKYSSNQDKPVELSIGTTGASIEIIVSDSGIGIPEQDLPHIFEPFYRVDKSRQTKTGGYGLGLSLCHKIVLAHGGAISVHSTQGHGTQFKVQIPQS